MMDTAVNLPAPDLQERRRGIVFVLVALISSAVLAWLLFTQPMGFNSPAGPAGMAILSACTFVFLRWISNPIPAAPGEMVTRRGRLALVIAAAAVPLFILPMLLRTQMLMALAVLAWIVLAALRLPITSRELGYALGLALVAALAGLGSGWIRDVSPVVWAGLQIALVTGGLLCGWKIFQRFGLLGQGIGRSRFLSGGGLVALGGFGLGALMSMPWALANVLMGGSNDPWVHAWWQPVVALQPGIAEEAWGRVLMVSLLFLIFRRVARPRVAFTAALILAAYWFAYLHTPMGFNGLFSTLLLGTLYALPLSYLCLYRDLETAIGFHFFIDFVRFLAAFLLLRA